MVKLPRVAGSTGGDALFNEHLDAEAVASEAGELLLEIRSSGLASVELKAEGDRRSNELILRRLNTLYPDDAVLSEEEVDDPARLEANRVWIVDPLDGTREFSEAGRSDWAVHVALLAGGELAAGAVALPAQGRTLSTAAPPRAPEPTPGRLRLLVSRTRPSEHAEALAHELDAELVPMGSAGAKVAAVITGDADVYAHSGGQYEWDSAAPVAVAAAAGVHASRLDGSPLRYNSPNPWLPDLLVCRTDIAGDVLSVLARLGIAPRAGPS
jgi:3'(2'), 5'-bisphosphate nucleotidase